MWQYQAGQGRVRGGGAAKLQQDWVRVPPSEGAEVKFVHPVSPGGSVKFVASSVNFSIFTHFLCFFLLKLLKLGEIDGVKFLT